MNLEIVNNREIKPQKVAVKQGEAGTTVLTFTRDSYKYDQIDLRKYKAYAITSCNGVVDMTECTTSVSGSQLIINWVLSEYTLRHAGVINYQIVFKDREDSAAVFNTYQAIIQCSESLDVENKITADYPTILQQNLDLIQTLSGEFGAEITYIPAGGDIPVEERLAGRLYYRWLEKHTSRATTATGRINLGHQPYADCGLYINGVHVYVDDTSAETYVIDAGTWVDAINSAACGVMATDVSSDTIEILLTATSSGAAGNSITLAFGAPLYGVGKGITNPCECTLSGAALTGGADEQVGVEYPTGYFEDSNGNILGYTRSKYVANADLDTLTENGEYICAGTMTNVPDDKTYAMVRVTDSTSTNRIIQEYYSVDIADANKVRMFVRAGIPGDSFGDWEELVKKSELQTLVDNYMVGYPDLLNPKQISYKVGTDADSMFIGYDEEPCIYEFTEDAYLCVNGSDNAEDGNMGRLRFLLLDSRGGEALSVFHVMYSGNGNDNLHYMVPIKAGTWISLEPMNGFKYTAYYYPMLKPEK